jgi:hypothetical protein
MKRLQLSQMVIGGVHSALCGIEARALESPAEQRRGRFLHQAGDRRLSRLPAGRMRWGDQRRKACTTVFRPNIDDPHPVPWIRVKVSWAIGKACYPHAQWDELARTWRVPLIELIWSYWHEEGRLVQTMNAISMRLQNRRGRIDRDPLATLEI